MLEGSRMILTLVCVKLRTGLNTSKGRNRQGNQSSDNFSLVNTDMK